MPRLIFIDPTGARHEVDANVGPSVMEAARDNNIDGITAACNGSAACGTCHAYFDVQRLDVLSKMEPHEDDMLDYTASERLSGSRLSCQVTVTDALDGMVIRLPEAQ